MSVSDSAPYPPVPPDDLARALVVAHADDPHLPHIGLVGDTYTILLSGKDTNGKFCLIDMHVPPEGGPPPHRHDYEETFTVQEGEIEVTFRGEKQTVRAGQTVHIPANAPHQFKNVSGKTARLLSVCAPAGEDGLFKEVGTPVATRITPAPKPSAQEQAEMQAKSKALAPKYRTEFVDKP